MPIENVAVQQQIARVNEGPPNGPSFFTLLDLLLARLPERGFDSKRDAIAVGVGLHTVYVEFGDKGDLGYPTAG